MKQTFLSLVIPTTITAVLCFLTGCGGGGSSGSKEPTPAPITSSAASTIATPSSLASSSSSSAAIASYNVSVNIPAAMALPIASNNLAAVSVNVAGDVLSYYTFNSTDITHNNNGRWTITVPLAPGVDNLIVVDTTRPINVSQLKNIHRDGLLYAPMTAADIDIDVASTSAYSNFLSNLDRSRTFASQPIATDNSLALEQVINIVQADFADETIAKLGTVNVTDAAAAIQKTVANMVTQELANLQNPAVATTAASLVRDEGGAYFFSVANQDINRTTLFGSAVTHETYKGFSFVPFNPKTEFAQFLILGPSGWVLRSNEEKITANNDGSVTRQDTAADGDKSTLSLKQAFDLSGRNIADFLHSNKNTRAMAGVVDPTATFVQGAKGYRFNVDIPDTTYAQYFNAGDINGQCFGGMDLVSASGGNCTSIAMRADDNTVESAVSGYAKLFSADVPAMATGYRAVAIGDGYYDRIEVQIINNANKTVKFYRNAWTGSYSILLATSTWSEITLPYLSNDNLAVHIKIPESVRTAGTLWWDANLQEITLAQQHGYLRNITIMKDKPNEDVVFNDVATTNINSASNYANPLVGTWGYGFAGQIEFINNNQYRQWQENYSFICNSGWQSGTYQLDPINGTIETSYNLSSSCLYNPSTTGNIFDFKIENNVLSIKNAQNYTIFELPKYIYYLQ